MKCNDCGTLLTNVTHPYRKDVCDGCWQTRLDIVQGKIVAISSPEFEKIQKKMTCGKGTAKRYIDYLKQLKIMED